MRLLMSTKRPRAIEGTLEPYWGLGSTGVVWSLQDRRNPTPDGLRRLSDGDRLTVTDPENGRVVFDDVVRFETRRGWRRFHDGARHGQQALDGGVWVEGVPVNVDAEHWAAMFSRRLDARVIPACA